MNSFIKTASILLVSSKTTHRSGLRKILCDLGADNHAIEVASDFEQSKERLSKSPVNIVIADDDISETKTGPDLIPLHEKNLPSSRKRLFILMTGELTPFLEASFAMKGGDLIVKKPFTNAAFTAAIETALNQKASMSPEEEISLDLSDALRTENISEANNILGRFKNFNSAAALFSKGQILESEKSYDQAFDAYILGLSKAFDFRTLVGAVNAGSSSRRFGEMGEIVEKWIRKFPLYDKSVPDMTRVVIYNQRFDLLRDMLNLMANIKSGDQLARRALSAGLVVAALNSLQKEGDKDNAIEYAAKGITLAESWPPIVIRGFEVLLQAGGKEKAVKIFEDLSKQTAFNQNQDLKKQIQLLIQG